MRRRSNLLVILGIAFFIVGGVIVYLLTDDEDDGGGSAGESQEVSVVVAANDIPAGTLADELIDQGALRTTQVPVGSLVPGAIQSVNQLEGATFVQGFAKDQQITSSGVQLRTRTFQVPEGFDGVAVQIDFVPGGAGYVSPGDRINLYGVYRTALADRLSPRVELLLTNVEVLDVDTTIPPRRGTAATQQPEGGTGTPSQRPSTEAVTYLLALRPADAEKAIYQTEFETLYASLTGDEAPPAGPTPGRDQESILAEEPNAAFAG